MRYKAKAPPVLNKFEEKGAEKMTQFIAKKSEQIKQINLGLIRQGRPTIEEQYAGKDGEKYKPQILKRKFSHKQKNVIAKVLYELGWGRKQISQWLKIDGQTVINVQDRPTPAQLRNFEAVFRSAMSDMSMELEYLVNNRLRELIPMSSNLAHLVKVGSYLKGPEKMNLTQNNYYESLAKKYSMPQVIDQTGEDDA